MDVMYATMHNITVMQELQGAGSRHQELTGLPHGNLCNGGSMISHHDG